ncbi:MAG: DUF4435 domain-containing protein [Cyanobacteria bacterium SBLK]|nr:DUF4435 domain-containing protein [Cyanobacteria bacterium SBLK]
MGKKKLERRRSLRELVSRYKREPELCDIYVEGESDRSFITWFLEAKGLKDFVVYDVATVEIPAENIQNLGLNLNSKRSSVITLANYLEQELAALSDTLRVTCICDRDFDILLNNTEKWKLKLLLFTDYSCLEMYWFNEVTIHKLLHSIKYNGDIKPYHILNILSSILLELFLIRAANQVLDFGIRMLENYRKCCQLKENSIFFDQDIYITKFLNHGAKRTEEKKFREKIEELRKYAEQNIPDPRMKMHGHDFGEILSWYIKKYIAKNNQSSYNREIVEIMLSLGGQDLTMLESETLFKNLLSRLSSRSE